MSDEIDLSAIGLCTLAQAARRRGRAVRTVQRWVEDGHLSPVRVPGSPAYYLRLSELDAFTPAPRGAPAGNQFARKSDRKKPTKTSTLQQSGKKSRNP